MFHRKLALAACLALGCLMTGCVQPPAAPRIWAASDMTALTNRTAMPSTEGRGPRSDDFWEAQSGTARLTAGANEVVAFQVVIDAPRGGCRGVRIGASALGGEEQRRIPAAAIAVYRMLSVEVRQPPVWYLRLTDAPVEPAGHYDPLVPFNAPDTASAEWRRGGGASVDLADGERLAVWVDLAVPRDAVPGDYRGSLSVEYAGGALPVRIELKVHDFVLPDAHAVPCIGAFDHQTIYRQFVRRNGQPFVPARLDTANQAVQAGLVHIRQLQRLAHAHRLDLFDVGIRPIIKRDSEGNIVLQWDDYDAIVQPYLAGSAFDDRIGVAAWAAPVHPGWPEPESYGGPRSSAYQATLAAVTRETVKHFREIGAAEQLFFWPRGPASTSLAPLPPGSAAYDGPVEFIKQIRPNSSGIAVLNDLPTGVPEESLLSPPKDLADLAEMHAPPADMLDLSQAGRLLRPDQPLHGLWLRPGRAPYLSSGGILGSPADIRVLPWLAMQYGCAGIFLPQVLNWEGEPYQSAEGSEQRLFYPAPSGQDILPSVRLKQLRRGLQDAAYLWLLRQRHEALAAALTNVASRPASQPATGTTTQPATQSTTQPATAPSAPPMTTGSMPRGAQTAMTAAQPWQAMLTTMVHYAGRQALGDNYLDVRLDGWVRDPAVWLAAHRLLAEEVEAAVHPDTAARRAMARGLAWRDLTDRAGGVRVERFRTTTETMLGGRYRALVEADLFNERAAAAEVTLELGALPEGWQGIEPRRTVKLLPKGRAVLQLAAQGDHVQSGSEAKMRLPVRLLVGEASREHTVAVPFLLAGLVAQPPAIDGNLGDWPLRTGNAAGEFVLLGRRNATGAGLARRQTLAFALHDEQYLYLAFRCQEPQPEKVRALPNNLVRYQQLMACEEDLVEVILDPGRRARQTQGLYHLTVKANGIVVTERGVASDPPLGESQPWPVAVKAAVGRLADAWTVELAIPLSAFGPAGQEVVWGVNFARFATATGESSSWSGAARYLYHPRELGTVLLVPREAPPRFQTTQPAGEGGRR